MCRLGLYKRSIAMVSFIHNVSALPVAGAAAHTSHTELGFASTLAMLSQFKQHMALQSMPVDTLQMLRDSRYATDQLALAHTTTCEPLRQCAMRVFALLHG
jgi:hypothetical protein